MLQHKLISFELSIQPSSKGLRTEHVKRHQASDYSCGCGWMWVDVYIDIVNIEQLYLPHHRNIWFKVFIILKGCKSYSPCLHVTKIICSEKLFYSVQFVHIATTSRMYLLHSSRIWIEQHRIVLDICGMYLYNKHQDIYLLLCKLLKW